MDYTHQIHPDLSSPYIRVSYNMALTTLLGEAQNEDCETLEYLGSFRAKLASDVSRTTYYKIAPSI